MHEEDHEVDEVDNEESEKEESECLFKPSHDDMIKAFETIKD